MIIIILISLVRKLRLKGVKTLAKVTQRVQSRVKTQTRFSCKACAPPSLYMEGLN